MSDKTTTLERLIEICLALPEALSEQAGRHVGFSIGKKKFAWYLDDHHGDGIVALSCRLRAMENRELVSIDPDRFYLPAYMAHHGWIALRLDVGPIDWDEVTLLVTESFRLQAPRRLASLLA